MNLNDEPAMLEIKDTLVSLDLIERFFCCDLDTCLGACCIEGDAGAPVTENECEELRRIYPLIKDTLLPSGAAAIERDGVAYVDEEGDLVTTIVDGGNCAFSRYREGGMCVCAVEEAYNRGLTPMRKPMSCYLYPVRLKQFKSFTAVNFHRWKICKCAEVLGRKHGIRAYKFLAGPLTERFGKEWYDELCEAAEAYLEQYPDSSEQ